MSRVIIVSNRLPVVIPADAAKPLLGSAGGLGTSMKSVHEDGNSLWIGWSGLADVDLPEERQEALARMRYSTVQISSEEIRDYYDGISNSLIWPLFHYLIQQLPYDGQGWQTYRNINQRFADATVAQYQPGDLIWIHDYHLTLVPGMIREVIPDAQIGFFLHIPFPSSEVFRAFPWREEMLQGLLGADLVGFHTFDYSRHFASSLVRILGAEPEVDRVVHEGRTVHFGAFPISIDVTDFETRAASPAVQEMVQKMRNQQTERFLGLGVDRLDYTKGIPRRLLAVERFFDKYPEFRGQFRFLQIAVPTRETSAAYADFRSFVNELVGRINSKHGALNAAPVHLLYRSVDAIELSALYLAADLMMVTPLRDGMNLVAKEFVASRIDGLGMLMLSEFAGAAAELGEAVLVNPYDIESVADRIRDCLHMEDVERRGRMSLLARRIKQTDNKFWSKSFLSRLESISQERRVPFCSPESIQVQLTRTDFKQPMFLLDYDGTLVGIRDRPAMAVPDSELVDLIHQLSEKHANRLWIVSGRHRADLDAWFPNAIVNMIAEHGLWIRHQGTWSKTVEVDASWTEKLRPILASFAERTPGSQIEEKSASIAWHYRMADPELGPAQAKELRLHLLESFSNLPVQILNGKMCVEIRVQGVNKGITARQIMDRFPHDLLIAAGDDQTDEDLFKTLPPNALTIKIGNGMTTANFRLRSPAQMRTLLRTFV
ncbi:MAG: bifunctional alpha,alpha-trehalose-phosphate synthase (UDP-forming)/trehalose-phosphatase [Leptospirales bacterium]|nr:bifunctional alpha,alpha-trehalose-phosphate synthase (UDP-forming)/trehalose-phosphatase [Leptospirales bacterium]